MHLCRRLLTSCLCPCELNCTCAHNAIPRLARLLFAADVTAVLYDGAGGFHPGGHPSASATAAAAASAAAAGPKADELAVMRELLATSHAVACALRARKDRLAAEAAAAAAAASGDLTQSNVPCDHVCRVQC